MTLYKNRDKLRGYSMAMGRLFDFLPANAWTAIALTLSFITAYFIITQEFVIAAATFAISAFLDSVDGAVARRRHEATLTGAYFDTVADRYMEGVVIISFMFLPTATFFVPLYVWAGIYLLGSTMTTYVKAAAKEELDMSVKGGILERPERMIIVFIAIVLLNYNAMHFTYIIAAIAILSNITALQRIKYALDLNRKAKR